LHGIVDIKPLFVGRKAQAVRLVEQIPIDHQFRHAAAGRNAIDALEAELAWTLDAIDRHSTVPRVGKINGAARMHADVIRTVEFLSLVMRGDDLAPSVRALAD